MDTKKLSDLTAKFETRKNNTTKALDDLYKIMSAIDDIVDNVTILNREISISYRASNYDGQSNLWHLSSVETPMYLEIHQGECVLYYDQDYDFEGEIRRNDLDYINLAETIQALDKLIDKLMSASTRQVSADKLASVAALFA